MLWLSAQPPSALLTHLHVGQPRISRSTCTRTSRTDEGLKDVGATSWQCSDNREPASPVSLESAAAATDTHH